MMNDAVPVQLVQGAYLDTASNHVSRSNSFAVPVPDGANAVMISATLINSTLADTDTLVVQLEGSYDGRVWLTTNLDAGADMITFDATAALANSTNSTRIDDVDYAFLRARATVTDLGDPSTPKVLFDVEVVFTHQ